MDINIMLDKITNWITTEGIRILLAVILLFLIFKIIDFVSNRIDKKLKNKREKIDETITRVLLQVFRKGLKFISFVCFLGYIGIETSSIAAAITSIGLAIGLALQGSLANFAGGVVILIMHPYKIGDYIESNGISGTVEEVKLFYTYIVTIDNKVVIIPNGKMADSSIINYSSKKLRRLDMLFNISYNSDLNVVKKALLDSVSNIPSYKQHKEPFINIEDYKDSYFRVILKVWCDNSKYWDYYYFLQEEVIKQFEKHDIEIPNIKIKVDYIGEK